MEKELKALFDYQRFEKNEKLEKMIRHAEASCMRRLSDDELDLVAGGVGGGEPVTKKEDSNKKFNNF